MLCGAIFDLDGTLLDSMSVWDGVGEAYLRSVGCEPPLGLDDAVRKLSLAEAAEYLIKNCGLPQDADEAVRGINAVVKERYERGVRPKPGVCRLVKTLSELGVRMAVVTETDAGLARAALRSCGIEEYFTDVLSTRALTAAGKHSPAVYELALAVLGTKRERTLVFEDALYALRTAREAGFRTAAVFDASEPEQEKLRMCAELYVSDFKDATPILKFFSAFGTDGRGGEGM